MRILIDGRMYGLENAGIGRYIVNLVGELAKIDRRNEYIILLRKKYLHLRLPRNWQKIPADFRHYSLAEQVKLPAITERYKPDLAHFPNFNVPFFYKGEFVVTIHDLLMQENRGATATTLPWYLYLPKQVAARIIFKKAVLGSEKIIVPSESVKKEVVDYFRVDPDKVVVTYEGVGR